MATLSSDALVEIAPSVYEVTGALGNKRLATWMVAGEDGVILVDVGVASTVGSVLMPALSAIGAAPGDVREVVITHADVDHFGGLAAARELFPRARLRASATDRPLIERWDTAVQERYGWYRRHGLDYDPAVWAAFPELRGADTGIDETLEPGAELRCGEAAFQVLALPGHTAGHIGLWEPRLGVALVGDALLGDGVPDRSGRLSSPPPYVTTSGYRETLDRLERLGAELRTSHFPPPSGRDGVALIHASRAFADRLEEAILAELGHGPRGLAGLWERLQAQLGPYPELSVELARSIHSHLEELEERGLVSRTDRGEGRWART